MKKILTVLVILCAVFVLSSCKKEDTGTQGITEDSVLVGNCAATAGDLAFVGEPFNAGINAYFKMINDNGGVDGRTISLINESDDFTSEKGVPCTRKMIEDNEVFALVGHFGTPTVSATLDLIEDAGIPTVYLATGIGALYNPSATGSERAIFPVQPIYQMEGRFMVARAVKDLAKTKIAVIYTNDDAGYSMRDGIEEQVDNMTGEGIEIVERQSFGATDTDVSSQIMRILESDAEIVLIASNQGPFVVAAKELAKQNSTLPVISSYVSASATYMNSIKADIYNETEDTYKFDVYLNAWVDLGDVDAVTEFTTAMTAYMGDDSFNANAYAMAGWIAGHFFIEGLKRLEGEEITWDSYIDAMEETPIDNPFGGQIDFADGQRIGTQEMSLLKLNYTDPLILPVFEPVQSIDEILTEE